VDIGLMNDESGPRDGAYTLAVEEDRFVHDRPAEFRFTVLDPQGEVVTEYRPLHERELHLIVVRRDLATFSHLHPSREADGTWHVDLALPSPGPYRAFADLAPVDGSEMTLTADLAAPGEWAEQQLPAPSSTAGAGDYQVDLKGELVAGVHSEITFRVGRDGRGVEPEPYLGALGHLVALRASDLTYLHVHPLEQASSEAVPFGVEVPSPGAYRLFLQFQHEHRVHTVAFTMQASEGRADMSEHRTGHRGHH
jgi:hypothetical protein